MAYLVSNPFIMPNNHSSRKLENSTRLLGWTAVLALLAFAAFSVYRVTINVFSHWHNEVAYQQFTNLGE
jgi:hypothetical protein